jgi:hypothetical protein
MMTRFLRLAAWVGCASLILTAGTSCDVLNPSLVNDLTGTASTSGPQPTGSILVAFNNQRGVALTLNYTVERNHSGTVTTSTEKFGNSGGIWAVSYDCDTTKVAITGISTTSSSNSTDTTDTTDTSDTSTTTSLALSMTFEPPALECGSVIYVNVPLLGSPTAEIVH